MCGGTGDILPAIVARERMPFDIRVPQGWSAPGTLRPDITPRALAVAAVLSLAACGGGGGSGSQPALGLHDIRELTGLSAPVETATAQQQRQQDIVSRADSLVFSTVHTELVSPDGTRTVRQLAECSGTECTLLDPTTGETGTVGLDPAGSGLGDAEAIGTAHGITLMSESGRHTGVGTTSLGAWMEHGSFTLHGLRAVVDEIESDTLHAAALGDLTRISHWR